MFVENFGKHQTGQANQREVAHTKILNKRLLTTPSLPNISRVVSSQNSNSMNSSGQFLSGRSLEL